MEMNKDVDIAMVGVEFVQQVDAMQGREEDAALRQTVDEEVRKAVSFSSVGSDVAAASNSSGSLGGQGGPVSWGSSDGAGGGSVGGGSDGGDDADGTDEEMSEEEMEQRLRQEFPDLSIGEIQWLKRQHKCLGHGAALEHLFKGRAKAAMKKIRKYCRKCMRQDDADQIRERGSLLQFATEKNKIWICDSMKSRLGKTVYITDGCTRLKVAELSDADQGGLTGAAVRAVMLMRMVSQGTAEKILFDEGSEFNNALFVKVCHSVNMRTHPIGFKSPHRISKIERMNGDNRRNVRKLTVEPYDDHVAALLWSRASQPILIETLDAVVEEFLSTENDSDVNPLDMQLKRELLAEHMAQLNSTPILGQSLTPYNLASGGYYSAARDWEQLREDLAEGEEFGDDMERWFRLKCRIQAAARKVIRQYDAEQLLRRREIVGHDSTGAALEHYPDEDFSDELERRITTYDDEEPLFADPMTSVQGGRSTASTRSSGGSGLGHNCTLCGQQCTSRARLVQHMAEKHGIREADIDEQPQVPTVFQRGTRRLIDFEEDDDEHDDLEHDHEPLAPPAIDVAFDEQGNPVDRWTETADAIVRWHNCMSTMELKLENGKLFLAPAESDAAGSVVRAYDFTVLPTVDVLLADKDRHEGRLRQSDECCYLFSQLLNGRPIKELLNGKDSRDVQYVVTGVEMQRNKKHISSQPMRGNSVFMRWRENLPPEFTSEDCSTWAPATNFWTARIFYETTASAHEAMQVYTKGTKSSAMQIELKTAEQFGFESYFIPSVRDEVKAIVSRGVFGRNAKRSEISDRNIMTSRLVVVIKVELGTGKVSKIKSRWVSRGFEDRRFSSKKSENTLNCRSHTMSDASYLLLLQYCQATRSATWNADVKEAFLEGMSFKEAHAGNEEYWANPNSTLWMTIPKVIQDLQEFGFGEVVELVKSIYGCKDAPYNWMLTFHAVLKTVGLKQSFLDPCLWLCFATPQEEEVLKQGYEAVTEYFHKQVKAIDLLHKEDTEGMASVILGMQHEKMPEYKSSSSPDFINPETEKLAQALTMRVQFKGHLVGAIGSHVDDTKSGGHLLFMLRLCAIFRRFPLGSFSRLDPGRRDAFIGREEQCVPEEVDKFHMQQMLAEKQQEIDEHKIEIPDEFRVSVDEQKLQGLEKKYNIDRTVKPHKYTKVDSIQVSAKVLEEGCRMQEDVVYVVGQEGYATKVQPIEKQEVLDFFRQRDLAKTKFQRKQVKNPFRGRVGELIWSLKTNSCISATVSDLAGQLIPAEKANSWEEVTFFVNDLSGNILMLQHSEASARRVARLGNLYEHYMMGCGDASKSRVGGTLYLLYP
eukprot:g18328.t1